MWGLQRAGDMSTHIYDVSGYRNTLLKADTGPGSTGVKEWPPTQGGSWNVYFHALFTICSPWVFQTTHFSELTTWEELQTCPNEYLRGAYIGVNVITANIIHSLAKRWLPVSLLITSHFERGGTAMLSQWQCYLPLWITVISSPGWISISIWECSRS